MTKRKILSNRWSKKETKYLVYARMYKASWETVLKLLASKGFIARSKNALRLKFKREMKRNKEYYESNVKR